MGEKDSVTKPAIPRTIRCWTLDHKIGAGSFGEVYLAKNNIGTQVAIKFENILSPHPQLLFEAKTLKLLRGFGVPIIYWYGIEGSFHIMVLELLGPSLEDVFNKCKRRFSIQTTCRLGLQMLDRLQMAHEHDFIHRDIKPNNFLLGRQESATCHQVYLIDFGLAKRFRDRFGMHIPYKEGKSLTGTARYVSVNTHLGIEQARRDDIEGLAYILVYFLKSSLPWQGLKANGKIEKYKKIMKKKLTTDIKILCSNLPKEIEYFLQHARTLKFNQSPNYNILRDYLKNAGWSHIGLEKSLSNPIRLSLYDWQYCSSSVVHSVSHQYIKNTDSTPQETLLQYQRTLFPSVTAKKNVTTPIHEKSQTYSAIHTDVKDKDIESNVLETIQESSQLHPLFKVERNYSYEITQPIKPNLESCVEINDPSHVLDTKTDPALITNQPFEHVEILDTNQLVLQKKNNSQQHVFYTQSLMNTQYSTNGNQIVSTDDDHHNNRYYVNKLTLDTLLDQDIHSNTVCSINPISKYRISGDVDQQHELPTPITYNTQDIMLSNVTQQTYPYCSIPDKPLQRDIDSDEFNIFSKQQIYQTPEGIHQYLALYNKQGTTHGLLLNGISTSEHYLDLLNKKDSFKKLSNISDNDDLLFLYKNTVHDDILSLKSLCITASIQHSDKSNNYSQINPILHTVSTMTYHDPIMTENQQTTQSIQQLNHHSQYIINNSSFSNRDIKQQKGISLLHHPKPQTLQISDSIKKFSSSISNHFLELFQLNNQAPDKQTKPRCLETTNIKKSTIRLHCDDLSEKSIREQQRISKAQNKMLHTNENRPSKDTCLVSKPVKNAVKPSPVSFDCLIDNMNIECVCQGKRVLLSKHLFENKQHLSPYNSLMFHKDSASSLIKKPEINSHKDNRFTQNNSKTMLRHTLFNSGQAMITKGKSVFLSKQLNTVSLEKNGQKKQLLKLTEKKDHKIHFKTDKTFTMNISNLPFEKKLRSSQIDVPIVVNHPLNQIKTVTNHEPYQSVIHTKDISRRLPSNTIFNKKIYLNKHSPKKLPSISFTQKNRSMTPMVSYEHLKSRQSGILNHKDILEVISPPVKSNTQCGADQTIPSRRQKKMSALRHHTLSQNNSVDPCQNNIKRNNVESLKTDMQQMPRKNIHLIQKKQVCKGIVLDTKILSSESPKKISSLPKISRLHSTQLNNLSTPAIQSKLYKEGSIVARKIPSHTSCILKQDQPKKIYTHPDTSIEIISRSRDTPTQSTRCTPSYRATSKKYSYSEINGLDKISRSEVTIQRATPHDAPYTRGVTCPVYSTDSKIERDSFKKSGDRKNSSIEINNACLPLRKQKKTLNK